MKKKLAILPLFVISLLFSCGKEKPKEKKNILTYESLCRRLYDSKELSRYRYYEEAHLASTYDRASRYDELHDTYINWDANYDGDGYERDEGGKKVLVDIQGQGYIDRVWTASPINDFIQIEIDGEIEYYGTFNNWQRTMYASFDELCLSTPEGAFDCYVPMTFKESLKIVQQRTSTPSYAQIHYNLVEGIDVEYTGIYLGEAQLDSLAKANQEIKKIRAKSNLNENSFALSLSRGETKTIYEANKAGGIKRFELLPLIATSDWDDVSSLSTVLLKVYYDGSESPSISIPIGDFFFQHYGSKKTSSILNGVMGDGTLFSNMYMPYKQIKVSLTNVGEKDVSFRYYIENENLKNVDEYQRLCVDWRKMEHRNDSRFPDAEALKVNGRGRFIATSLNVFQKASTLWWGEGDEKVFVDGEPFPSIFGTGSEDYFGFSWCSAKLFQNGFVGQTRSGNDNLAKHNGPGNRNLYRIHMLDSVPFEESLEFDLEKYWSDSLVEMAATSFFYLDSSDVPSFFPNVPSLEERAFNSKFIYDGEEELTEYLSCNLSNVMNAYGQPVDMQEMSSFKGGKWHDDAQIWWRATSTGGYLDFTINLPETKEYALTANLTLASDYGAVQLSIDGTDVGEKIDLLNNGVILRQFNVGEVSLSKGKHTLRITNVQGSGNYHFVGIDSLYFA